MSSSEELSTDSEFDNDDLDSEDDSDSDYSGVGPSYFLKKDFLKGGHDLDSDSEDEGRKVVKSAKEKLLDDIRESVDAVSNSKNVENWSGVLTEFDRLGKLLVRVNQQKIGIPNFFYKLLAELDETINSASTDKEKKKLPADQSRALNTLRQRIKKQTKEFKPYMDLYKESPEAFDSEEPLQIASQELFDSKEAVVGTVSGTAREMSPVFTTLRNIAETRGKKNIDKLEQVATLENLLAKTKETGSVFELISVYQMLLSVRFDAGSNQAFMPVKLWKSNEADAADLLALLEKNFSSYQVSEAGAPTDDIDVEPVANASGVKVVQGSISSVLERLDDEFAKYLQHTDPHSTEYIERLKGESDLYNLIVRAQVYVQSVSGDTEHLARIVLRRLDHLYFKPAQLIEIVEKAAWENVWSGSGLENSELITKGSEPQKIISTLRDFLFKQEAPIYKTTALLSYTYYLAVNNKYAEAREIFLGSHLYSHIHQLDSSVQVLYNRALVQLGLGAFKSGEIEESHQILNEIVNSQRVKELLGQGFVNKYPSQVTAAEKQKLYPFHMHINLELLDCVFMTASMLIEIPALAAASNLAKDSKRKTNIKSFKSKLEFHDRQYFTGPPESIKDHLIYASKSLQRGNWSKSYELLSSIKIWKLVPDTSALLLMLKYQLQMEGLRTYIFSYQSIFTKLSVEKLATMFQLEQAVVTSIVEKMLDGGEFQGSLTNNFINFTTDAPQRSRLQELAIVMNEKVGMLNEKNEQTSSNGHFRKQMMQQQQQQQKEQKEQKEILQEENSKFRYANINTNNDEFQVTA